MSAFPAADLGTWGAFRRLRGHGLRLLVGPLCRSSQSWLGFTFGETGRLSTLLLHELFPEELLVHLYVGVGREPRLRNAVDARPELRPE